jgi:hypothetical protein
MCRTEFAGSIRQILLICILITITNTASETYYISQSEGNDINNGTTSSTAWKTLLKASKTYQAGDQILFKCGDIWVDEKLDVSGKGTSSNPIALSSYGTGSQPVLSRTSVGSGQICIEITNPSGWKIANLKFDTGLFGVYLHWDGDYDNDYIWVENCEFYNFDASDYTYGFPCGLWFKILNGNTSRTYCSNITVTNCYFQDCLNGVDVYAFTGGLSFLPSYLPYSNVNIFNCYGYSCGSTPVGVSNTTGGGIHDNIFVGNGDHYNSTGSCAGFLMWVKDFSIEKNEYAYSKRIGADPDGTAFDFEAMCDNVLFKDNFVHDADGCGLYLYNNGGVGGNTNLHIVGNLLSNNGLNPPDANRRNEISYGAGTHTGNIDSNIFYLATGVGMCNNTTNFTLSGNIQTSLVEANGTNLALKANASSSSQYDSNHGADKVKDSAITTCWKSASGLASGEWVQLDFDSLTTVNKCEIIQDVSSSISRFAVQYWDGGSSSWKDMFNGLTLGNGKLFPVKAASVRRIRLYIYSTDNGCPAISEFCAYNVAHTAKEPIPGDTTKVNDNDIRITYSGFTYLANFPGYHNNDVHYTLDAGSYAQFTFSGTNIKWIGGKNNNHGKVDVLIDGAFDTTIDTYDPSNPYQEVLYDKSGLPYGSHVLKIVQRSDKNTNSTNYYTDIDAFEYSGSASTSIHKAKASPGSDALAISVSPNPFNPDISIRFALDEKAGVAVRIFDIRGKLVRTLIDGKKGAGLHVAVWNGRDNSGRPLSSGIYVIKLSRDKREEFKRVQLIK